MITEKFCHRNFLTLAFTFTIFDRTPSFSTDNDLLVFKSWDLLEGFLNPDGNMHNLKVQRIVFFVIIMGVDDRSTVLSLNSPTLIVTTKFAFRFAFR